MNAVDLIHKISSDPETVCKEVKVRVIKRDEEGNVVSAFEAPLQAVYMYLSDCVHLVVEYDQLKPMRA